ncbi:hypothetical protein M5K25_020785 [Dendrobium thyrsiflorum]|uniref:ENTH domain-containing protein n=1 Tax=Dendrobium thyrsiflorum TaxID=117978 RepID=A0ABD0UHT1_DENTH
MAPSKIRKALGAVKDQTSIGLAKVSNSTTLAELEVAIVKATRHDEYPAEEKHVREILSLTSYSRTNIAACVALLSRRLGKTRSWAVALKALVLIHRLLAEGDPAYEREVFFGTRRGTRMLNMADFRDAGSRSDAWDFSAFVRTYARYLDERLEYKMFGRRYRGGSATLVSATVGWSGWRRIGRDEEGEEGEGAVTPARLTPVREMKTDRLLVKAHHLQMLLDRLLACRPTGVAKDDRIVAMALYPIIKESFQIYLDMTEITSAFVDRFTELLVTDCVRVHDLFSKLSKQFEELDSFHSWSRAAGIARPSDYPEIEHITENNLKVMEEFIRERSSLPDRQLSQRSATQEQDAAFQAVNDVKSFQAPPPEEPPEEVEEIGNELVELAAAPEVAAASTVEEEKLADLLHIQEDAATSESHPDSLALTLFDGVAAEPPPAQPWEPFKETADWEKALVESASTFHGQKAAPASGFNMLMLEGMYSQGTATDARVGGNASSMAVMAPAAQAMLALPAPASGGVRASGSGDPFEASAAVAPPPWVQMSEMERKQRLFVEEQLMWQQYTRDGMQGKLPVTGGGGYPYNRGGYTQRF